MKRGAVKITGAAVVVVALLITGVLLYLPTERRTLDSGPEEAGGRIAGGGDEARPRTADRRAEAEEQEIPVPPGEGPPGALGDALELEDWAAFEQWAAESLREQFGQTISNRGNQASLMQLRRYLKENHPADWETKLHDLLHRAFPDVADQILDTFSKMDAYNEWFEENKLDLAQLQHREIREALSQRREEIFGEDAKEIWPLESGTAHIRDTIDVLEEARDVPLEHKLQVFRSSMDESYRDGAGAFAQDDKNVMALAFLGMESVQDELKEMGPDERAESLRHIRRSMGIREEEIEEMEELDAAREQRWQNGLRYMEERDLLTEDYEGPRLEEELRFLRERYFEDEAETIEAEEASGFFRYKRRRVYGRN